MNSRVSAYAEACEAIARRLSRGGRARQVGAEFDDLYQEGLIMVWLTLAKGISPSAQMIENRMRDWMRYVNRQSPIPYEAMLPLDDVRASTGQ